MDNAEDLWNRLQTLKVRFEHLGVHVQNPGIEYTEEDLTKLGEDGQRLIELMRVWMADTWKHMDAHRKKE